MSVRARPALVVALLGLVPFAGARETRASDEAFRAAAANGVRVEEVFRRTRRMMVRSSRASVTSSFLRSSSRLFSSSASSLPSETASGRMRTPEELMMTGGPEMTRQEAEMAGAKGGAAASPEARRSTRPARGKKKG